MSICPAAAVAAVLLRVLLLLAANVTRMSDMMSMSFNKYRALQFKTRLVANGFRQKEGVDFDEVFAPVSKYFVLRALMAVAAVEDMLGHGGASARHQNCLSPRHLGGGGGSGAASRLS